jgi:hypothetical protein
VSLLIYNGLFYTYANLFEDTVSVEIFTPNRENYGTTETFLALISSSIALPYNLQSLDPASSFYLFSYSPSDSNTELERATKVFESNWFQPNSRY